MCLVKIQQCFEHYEIIFLGCVWSYYAKLRQQEMERERELAEKYRDRARERRDGVNKDYEETELISTTANYRAVGPTAEAWVSSVMCAYNFIFTVCYNNQNYISSAVFCYRTISCRCVGTYCSCWFFLSFCSFFCQIVVWDFFFCVICTRVIVHLSMTRIFFKGQVKLFYLPDQTIAWLKHPMTRILLIYLSLTYLSFCF